MTSERAAARLVELLIDADRPYRSRWESLGQARGDRAYNQTAIGKVLAQHYRETGRIDEVEEPDWPREHRHWLGDRLSGTVLAPVDVDDFTAAFRMTSSDRGALHALLEGAGSELTPRGYHSISIEDRHFLGPDRMPARHETDQTIEADRDAVDVFSYVFDTDAVSVETLEGGVAGPLQPRSDQLWGVDIRLHRALATGERTRIRHVTTFGYRVAPPAEFRRGVAQDAVADVALEVHFWPADLPTNVWQAFWVDVDDDTTFVEQELPLDGGVARVRSSTARAAVVGVRWAW